MLGLVKPLCARGMALRLPALRSSAQRFLSLGLRSPLAGLRLPLVHGFATSRSLLTPDARALAAEDVVAYKAQYIKPTPEETQPLKEAPALYARIHIHNWDMLVTPGDIVKLPVRMADVKVGDTLRLSECSEIGSRNHTLSGGDGSGKSARIDPSIFTIRGVVLEKSRVKRSVAERTRRRRRHVRHVVSNNALTVIRVSEITLN